ncbi:MAG: hypothetical protein QOG69_735 [Actinomycetota bacterium]|nr:hypothetical protein [Actinomycetota bacterium]
MRAAFSGLTTRGRSFLAAGVAACLCGFFLSETDLLRVGIFLCALPIATAIVVARTRYRLSCARRIEPQRIPVGESSQVVLRIENLSRVATGILLLEDRLPYSLGGRPRFVISRIESRGAREVAYPVRSDVRGRFVVGPLSLRFADLFGLVELTRSFTSTDALVVTPTVVPLPPIHLGGDWAGGGDSRARSISTMGEDDVTTREYRHGDDLRRVHWRSTARYGELMVRREEQPWQNRGVLLLDTRAGSHRGDGPGSSFEWAVSATASVGAHLARDGFGLRFVTDIGNEVSGYSAEAMAGTPFEGVLLDTLALVSTSGGQSLSSGLASIRRGGGEGLVIAVLGSLTDADLDALTRFRHHASACVAIMLDTATWTSSVTSSPHRDHAQSCALLAGAGWRVLSAGARTDLRTMWGSASTTAPALAAR